MCRRIVSDRHRLPARTRRLDVLLGSALLALLLPPAAGATISDPAIVAAVQAGAGTDFSLAWSDPTYLYQDFSFTPVVETGLARFQSPAGVDVGAILVLLTQVSSQNPSGLYPHDYRVCQSIHDATLVSLSPFRSMGAEFLMMEMEQPSIHEFAATLQVREDSGNYVLDSQLFSVLYESALAGKHYTFQVWSQDSTTTAALVGRLLAALAGNRPLVVKNTLPRTLPVAVIRRVQMIADRVMLDLEAPQAVDNFVLTLVSWEYPNPIPNVTHWPQSLGAGRRTLLLPVTATTTDVQVYLDYQGTLQDKVLTSFNAWGPLASGWFPFSDLIGSSAAILRAPLSGLPARDGEVVMNGSSVELSGNLVSGGFIGMYVDVLPALQGAGDLTAYDRWIFRARQISSSSTLPVEMKIELDNGTSHSVTIAAGPSWAAQEVLVSRFGDWQTIGNHVRRVVFAVTGSTGAVALDIDRLSLVPQAVPCPDCPGAPPAVVTQAAGQPGYTSAYLNGSVNPNGLATSGWFEWGTTTDYGFKTPYQDLGAGTQAVPLAFPLSNITCAVQYHFRAAAANAAGTAYGGDTVLVLPECPPANGGRRFFTVTPCRALDTRIDQAYQSGIAYTVTLGALDCRIPSSSTAVAANITVVRSTGGGYLAAWRAGDPMPSTSVINFAAGQTRANNVILALDPASGRILVRPSVTGGGSVDVIIDVNGYFD